MTDQDRASDGRVPLSNEDIARVVVMTTRMREMANSLDAKIGVVSPVQSDALPAGAEQFVRDAAALLHDIGDTDYHEDPPDHVSIREIDSARALAERGRALMLSFGITE